MSVDRLQDVPLAINDLMARVEALEKRLDTFEQRVSEPIDAFIKEYAEMKQEHKDFADRVRERLRNGARWSRNRP
jgi:hypothetical protein